MAGCTSTKTEDESADTMQPMTEQPETVQPAEPAPAPEPVKPSVSTRDTLLFPINDVDTEELPGIFYFDFDQAIVKRSGHAELNKHAKALADDPSLRVRLEGHADERGTREYNLALGERRANAVKAYLMSQGALASQIEVISYGEEKPAVDGHNEAAWAKNRRVQIVYKK
ncbi:MAG: peptidoglycan-associated lipoprotein Pal [Pseudomonadales bacterium]|nr:peptidoglycan-associated lipoprotein Pal [Pseudomonadales bacterium]